MEKPIIATNIDGLLIEHEAFVEPHKDWFERAIKKTGDESLRKWIGADPYFPGVNIAMKKIMPNTSKEKQTTKARKWYQKDVIRYIKKHPEKIKKDIAEKIESLKEKYKIILLTTNSKDYINKILKISKLNRIYDEIIGSETKEEPSKEKLINMLIEKYGKPKYYLTGKPEDKINANIKKIGIKVIGIESINKL